VDRVSEQRYASGKPNDHGLKNGREKQADEGPLDGPDPSLGSGDRRIDHAVLMTASAVFLVRMRAVVGVVINPLPPVTV
jgi:hypothetical protein